LARRSADRGNEHFLDTHMNKTATFLFVATAAMALSACQQAAEEPAPEVVETEAAPVEVVPADEAVATDGVVEETTETSEAM
jgi:hypothetical protein